jgi:hypothetical protein
MSANEKDFETAYAGGPQDPGGYAPGWENLARDDGFSEGPTRGFPGGGAQVSEFQPTDMLAGPLAEAAVGASEALGPAARFAKDIPFKAREAAVAFHDADKFGGSPFKSAAREFANVRRAPKDNVSRMMQDAAAEFKAKYNTPEKLAAFKKDADAYQEYLSKWRMDQEGLDNEKLLAKGRTPTPTNKAAPDAGTNAGPTPTPKRATGNVAVTPTPTLKLAGQEIPAHPHAIQAIIDDLKKLK